MFTNRDMEVFENCVSTQPGAIVRVSKDSLEALLERTKAAERCVGHCESAHQISMTQQDRDDLQAWLKSKGDDI